MDEFKLSVDVLDQIKDFKYWDLTEEQKLLIDKLISNEELKRRYKENGLCKNCKQPRTNYEWCSPCIFYILKLNKNWTSGNNVIDEFIQKTQLETKSIFGLIEWIEYDRFENVEYLAKGGFGTVHKAIWKDGYIHDIKNNEFIRSKNHQVVLKCLYNSQDITVEFLNEVS